MDVQFPVIIAYNMEEKKIGCVLAQAALGATLTGGHVTFYFDTIHWELDPSKCKLYTIHSQIEFDFMVKITRESYEDKRFISRHQSGRDQSENP